ncbi:MAG TPA: hypothetical protein VIR54_26645 [Vicinamibacterales bacterium]
MAISWVTVGAGAIRARLTLTLSLLSGASRLARPHKNSSELVGLFPKRLRVSAGAYLGLLEDLEPQGGLINLLDSTTEFVDEVGARLGATNGPIMRRCRRGAIG